MGLGDKLRQASNNLGRLRLSIGRDSYYQYKRWRKHERKQADHAHEQAKDSAESDLKTGACMERFELAGSRVLITGASSGIGRELVVLTLEGDQASAITWFGDKSVFPHFGLPRTLRD
jgi:hypothetical protein